MSGVPAKKKFSTETTRTRLVVVVVVVVAVIIVVVIIITIVQRKRSFSLFFFFFSNYSCSFLNYALELQFVNLLFSASIRITSRVNNCQENQEANNTGGDIW